MYQDYNWNQGYRGGQSGGGYQNYRSGYFSKPKTHKYCSFSFMFHQNS